ncbi:5'-3' exoribonuclease 2-like [Lycium barbarum]|uniref:5'-3' exoribonuclease 2-like n=1 Tax=Lycium barbarum TaxID=112863 RepID=UPI00293E5B8F|nr:5'-3' exoribonuclease 2-like [Lycium barbarum]
MADTSKLHPATTVTNIIKSCIPIVLDYEGSQYNNWATLFKLHCRANLVIDHILPPASPTVPPPVTAAEKLAAKALWERLDDIVRTKKSARALALDAKFTNTKLVDFPNVKAYCTRLKVLVDNLTNVGHKVFDERLVLRLLRGLSEEYKTFRPTVQHHTPLPSFDVVRSMLELEEDSHAEDAIHDSDSNAALVSHNVTPQNFSGNGQPNNSANNFNNRGNSQNRGKKNNRGRSGGNRNNRGGSGNGQSSGGGSRTNAQAYQPAASQ